MRSSTLITLLLIVNCRVTRFFRFRYKNAPGGHCSPVVDEEQFPTCAKNFELQNCFSNTSSACVGPAKRAL